MMSLMCKLNREGGVTRYATAIYIISQRIINFNVELKIYIFLCSPIIAFVYEERKMNLGESHAMSCFEADLESLSSQFFRNLDTFMINGQEIADLSIKHGKWHKILR